MAHLAQNSASSPATRGRVSALDGFFMLIGDMTIGVAATALSEAIGIPATLVRVGLVQIALVGATALICRGQVWSFGLRVEADVEIATSEMQVDGEHAVSAVARTS